jgi:hypothetical protein
MEDARKPVVVISKCLGFAPCRYNGAIIADGFCPAAAAPYRLRKVPLSVPLSLGNSWIIRFGQPYLQQQTFLQPYPEELLEISDSGKGRDF